MVLTKKFSEFANGGDLSNDKITVGLSSLPGTNTYFDNPWTFLASGATGDRPAPAADMHYRLRLNTTLEAYEYYDPTLADWVQLANSTSVISAIGTENQVLVNGTFGVEVGGDVTFTTPQDIAPTSSPAFASVQTPLILDQNGNTALAIVGQANAVAYITVINQATGQAPSLISAGETNTNFNIQTTGLGVFSVLTESTVGMQLISGTGYQHETRFIFSDTAAIRDVTWQDASGTVAYLSDVAGTVTSLQGTANQVLVDGTSGSPETGALTLTLPQDIAPASSPEFFDLTLSNGLVFDTNANIAFGFSPGDPSAVNYLAFLNSATGINASLTGAGTDPNVGITFAAKGTAFLSFETLATSNQMQYFNGPTYQHATVFNFANTAATRTVTFQDSSGTLAYLSDIPAGGITTASIAGTTQAAAVNTRYIVANAGQTTITLPTTFAIGDVVIIKGLGAGGWILAAGAATTIHIGSGVTSAAGSLTSANQYDTVCVSGLVANTTWSVDYVLSTGLTIA